MRLLKCCLISLLAIHNVVLGDGGDQEEFRPSGGTINDLFTHQESVFHSEVCKLAQLVN